jgi:hypothetical protein
MQSYKIQVLENRTPNWNALSTNFQNDRHHFHQTVKLDTSLINLLTFPNFHLWKYVPITFHFLPHPWMSDWKNVDLALFNFMWMNQAYSSYICQTTFESYEHFKNFYTCQADFCLEKTSFLLFVQNINSNLAIISFHETRKGANTFKQQHYSEKKCLVYQPEQSHSQYRQV